MSLNLKQSNVTLDEPFTPMLDNLQANILKFHGRKFAHHLFIQVLPEEIQKAKAWITQFATTKVTSAFKQISDAEQRLANEDYDGGTVYTLSLSNYAYRTLRISSSIQQEATFNNGMHARADFLGDHPETWDAPFYKSQLDLLIIVADDDAALAASESDGIIAEISAFGKCLLNQRGNVLKWKVQMLVSSILAIQMVSASQCTWKVRSVSSLSPGNGMTRPIWICCW